MSSQPYLERLEPIARGDVAQLFDAEKKYGDSWLRRGGVGAYFVTVRKYDRIETIVKGFGYDVFAAFKNDLDSGRPETGFIDDVRDLRCYLALWEAEGIVRGVVKPRVTSMRNNPLVRDDDPPHEPLGVDLPLARSLLDKALTHALDSVLADDDRTLRTLRQLRDVLYGGS